MTKTITVGTVLVELTYDGDALWRSALHMHKISARADIAQAIEEVACRVPDGLTMETTAIEYHNGVTTRRMEII